MIDGSFLKITFGRLSIPTALLHLALPITSLRSSVLMTQFSVALPSSRLVVYSSLCLSFEIDYLNALSKLSLSGTQIFIFMFP